MCVVLEMRALAELLGAYGVRYFSRKMVQRIMAEVEELKVISYLMISLNPFSVSPTNGQTHSNNSSTHSNNSSVNS